MQSDGFWFTCNKITSNNNVDTNKVQEPLLQEVFIVNKT